MIKLLHMNLYLQWKMKIIYLCTKLKYREEITCLHKIIKLMLINIWSWLLLASVWFSNLKNADVSGDKSFEKLIALKEKFKISLSESLFAENALPCVCLVTTFKQQFFSLVLWTFKLQLHKMVKQTQIICRLLVTNCLNEFDHFVGLALKELIPKTL